MDGTIETTDATPTTVIARRPKPGLFEGICWILVVLGALAAGVQAVDTFLSAESAPQQAAGAGMACMLAIVPYVLARAVSELRR
ncbi:MAG: hypothetical protein ABMA15_10420 [Vicinamibacterales bacterium]